MVKWIQNSLTAGRAFGGVSGMYALITSGGIATMIGVISHFYDDWGLAVSLLLAIYAFLGLLFLFIGVFELKDRIFPDSRPVAMLEVFKMANKCGWNLSDDNRDIFELCRALKGAALSGDIEFRGSKSDAKEDFIRANGVGTIPADHWHDFDIEWGCAFVSKGVIASGYKDDNFSIRSYCSNIPTDGDYNDLHVKCDNVKKWLKNAAKNHKGGK